MVVLDTSIVIERVKNRQEISENITVLPLSNILELSDTKDSMEMSCFLRLRIFYSLILSRYHF